MAEATKACRMRRTRGDTGRLRFRELAERAGAVREAGFPGVAALLGVDVLFAVRALLSAGFSDFADAD